MVSNATGPSRSSRTSGFDVEYTLPIWKMSRRREDRAGFRDARESVLGNAYDPDIIAFLLAELAWQRGLLATVCRAAGLEDHPAGAC